MRDKIDGLRPFFKRLLLAHKISCMREFQKEGISIYYYCGLRSPEEQNRLYSIGRNGDTRKTITNAMAGKSYHQYGLAADFCPVVGGKLVWDDEETFERFGILAEALGLEWGGRFRSVDKPHVQLTGDLSCGDIQKLSIEDVDGHIEARYRSKGLMAVLELVEQGGCVYA